MNLFRLWLLLWGLGVVCAPTGHLHAQGTQKLVRRNAQGQLIYSTAKRNITTYPRGKAGSKAFGKAVTTGAIPLTLTVANTTTTTSPVTTTTATTAGPVSVTNATPPNWLSARSSYSTSLARLDVEAAPVNSSDAIQLMFERQDGVALSGSNPDKVPLQSGTFFGSGPLTGQGSFNQQWAFGQKSDGTGGVPKVPLKLTFKRGSDTYSYLYAPTDATRATLFTATVTTPPPSSTTSSTPTAQTFVASAGQLPGPGSVPTYSDWNSRGANYFSGAAFRTAPASVVANYRSSFDYPVPSSLMAWPMDAASQNTKVLGSLHKLPVGPVIRLDGTSITAEIRLRYGGGIAIYDKSTGYQAINWPDHGRQAEITLYSGPQNYSAQYGGQWYNIGYDPIGVGNTGEIGSPVQAVAFVTGNDSKQYLYVKTQLLNWPSGYPKGDGTVWPDELTGCWLERWIRVQDDKVLVKARVTNDNPDQTAYGGYNQEYPNFIMNSSTAQVAFSTGGGITTSNLTEQGQNDNAFQASHGVPRGFQQTPFNLAEPWQAIQLHGKWWGIAGPDYYRASNSPYKLWGGGGPGEDTGDDEGFNPATYLSAQVMLETGPRKTYYTEYTFMVNADLNAIRSYANSIPTEALDYSFNQARGNNMWYCSQGHETGDGDASGWPLVLGQYNPDLKGQTARFAAVCSPVRRWQASTIGTVYVKMAYSGNRNQLTLNWLRAGQNPNGMDPNRPNESAARFPNGSAVGQNAMAFNVVGDGQVHTYAVPVGNSGDWRDTIQQVFINGFETAGEPIRLVYVGQTNPN